MDPNFEERQGYGGSRVNDSASLAVPATVDVKTTRSIEGGPIMSAKSKGLHENLKEDTVFDSREL